MVNQLRRVGRCQVLEQRLAHAGGLQGLNVDEGFVINAAVASDAYGGGDTLVGGSRDGRFPALSRLRTRKRLPADRFTPDGQQTPLIAREQDAFLAEFLKQGQNLCNSMKSAAAVEGLTKP